MTMWISIGLIGLACLAVLALRWPRRARPAGAPIALRAVARTGQPRQTRRAFLASLVGATALTAVGGAGFLASSRPGSSLGRFGGLAAMASAEPGSSGGTDANQATPAMPEVTPTVSLPTPTASPPRQPNVLVITVDTLRADKLGVSGFGLANTPNLDRIAAEGASFSRMVCQLPQTNPSHATLFTGRYPSTNGVRVHMVDKLRSGTQTMAQMFSDAGYKTAGIYSWVSLDPQFCGLNQGFQSYNGYVVNRNGVFANSQLEGLAALYRQLKSTLPVVSTTSIPLGENYEETMDGRADVTTAAALAWLDGYTGPDPFMLWVHYYDPHYPYLPPAPYDHVLGLQYSGTIDGTVATVHKIQQGQLQPTPDDIARLSELYQGEIAFADSQIGKLLDDLRTRGLLDDTIVAVAADHGESFAEHGDWFHGWKLWQTETHVPLILRYPSRIPAGFTTDASVQIVDVLPTLADLTGLTLKQSVQGTSLLPLLDGSDDGSQRFAFTELGSGLTVSLVSGSWAMIQDLSGGQPQLFNLLDDSGENVDISQAETAVTANLSARLGDLAKVAGVVK